MERVTLLAPPGSPGQAAGGKATVSGGYSRWGGRQLTDRELTNSRATEKALWGGRGHSLGLENQAVQRIAGDNGGGIVTASDGWQVLGQGKSSADLSPGVVAPGGGLVFISGRTALGSDGQIVGEGDVEGQTRYIFESIQDLLQEAGGSLRNIVKLTTFLTDVTRYAEFAKVRREVFEKPYPASTLVEVSALVRPGLLVEVEAIAVV